MSETALSLPSRRTLVWRGICGRCPKCGEGRLFTSYLKLNAACPLCGEDFSTIRADDGPAWLTILVTGHIMVPASFSLASQQFMPQSVALLVFLLMTTLIALILLPRTKGIFVGIIWWLRQQKVNKTSRWDQIAKTP